ncbi:hypothetical protein LOD99_13670 [Oopsacas minuta]|uniref:C2H2-type domain-containing protein n=1 Tax=Oopsacas minuta TaxID=111878 RepID=A0AAV7KHZ6_9METZ|nr:hypothetical protein LOD99_13670 [Oopsacas minuta]
MVSKLPHKLVVILGSTGTGKTDLSLRIAQKFNGEIVNADSMQIYKSLDILTNKPTQLEFDTCRHHLFNVFNPNEQCNVFEFQRMALSLIDQIYSRGNLPVLVGGTHCYIDSVIFHYLISNKQQTTESMSVASSSELFKLDSGDQNLNYPLLMEIDPISATRIHPNDSRKTIRALEVFYQTGRKLSEHISEQKQESGIDSPTGPLRFEDSCVIWLDCERAVLYNRLDKRVDKMNERGLLQEVKEFYVNEYLKSSEEMKSRGLLQSIGFKEWLPYLEEWHNGRAISSELESTCIQKLKQRSRNYARSQLAWIRNRYLIKRGEREISRFYKLDTTDLLNWEDNVGRLSDKIVSAYMRDELPKDVISVTHTPATTNNKSYNFCDRCQIVLIGDKTLQSHLKSRRHSKRGTKLKRLQNLLLQQQIKKHFEPPENQGDILSDVKSLF